MATTNIGTNTVAPCGLPLFHVHAVFVTGLAPWLVGAEVVLASPQGYRNSNVVNSFWALVEKYKVSYFSAVPTILSDLLNINSQGYDLSSLDFCACGAAPLSVELMSQFEARTGLVVLEGYSQTEGYELLAFARENISERAAVPKNIYILDTLPRTAIGKLFNPELRNDIIKRVVEEELNAIDQVVELGFSVAVEFSTQHGQIAQIELPESEKLRKTVGARLDLYAFSYQIHDQFVAHASDGK